MASPPRLARKRAYLPPSPADGTRVLVDRLWPRGLAKAAARIDVWMKDAAPSPALRVWFGHDAMRFEEFRTRYRAELRAHAEAADAVASLLELARRGPVTLVYGAKDDLHNHAIVLEEFLRERAARAR